MRIRFGDLDDIELIANIEKSFAIKLPHEEISDCYTFGELFDCVAGRVDQSPGAPCLSALAFRRIRKIIGATLQGGGRLRPSTRLCELAGGLSWRRWRRRLERESGLEIPPLPTAAPAPAKYLLWIGLMVAPAMAALVQRVGADSYLIAPLLAGFAAVAAIVPFLLIVYRPPHPELTVADLVRVTAPCNVGVLLGPRRPIRRDDLWASLEAMTRAHASCDGPIDRRTRFEHMWP